MTTPTRVKQSVVPPSLSTAPAAPSIDSPLRAWRTWVLTLLALVALAFALLGVELGHFVLVAFGLLLAFSTGSGGAESTRSVSLTQRNLALAAVMVAGFGWFWLWHRDLRASMLVVIAAAVIALPLMLQESDTESARQRTVVLTRRSLILTNVALVTLVP